MYDVSTSENKDALIAQVLPEGTEKATQFVPPVVNGWNPDVTTVDYDPEKAKELLAEAGYDEANPLQLTFNYPVNVSRPYMPNPEQIFTVLSSQLTEAGVQITPQTDAWSPEYLDRITGSPDHGIHLLGWTGDYNDTDNFVGVFFGTKANEWGFDNPALFTALKEARGMSDATAQKAKYEEINKMIADFVPGVPLTHAPPSLAFGKGVDGYVPSPVQDEVWNGVSITK